MTEPQKNVGVRKTERISSLESANQNMTTEKQWLSRTEDLLDRLLKHSHS